MERCGSVVITCGPAYEPIDEVRRLTNHSTGELGLGLATHLAAAGWEVECFAGVGATWHEPPRSGVRRRPFTTNEDLQAQLAALPGRGEVAAVFHCAALCDFRVRRVLDAEGHSLQAPKIPSRAGALTLELEPAAKILPLLTGLFPAARVVGWKYEPGGTSAEACEKGATQLREHGTALCIVNGAGYGAGFGVLTSSGLIGAIADKEALCVWLRDWLER